MKKILKALMYFIGFSVIGIFTAYLTFYILSTTKSYEVPSLSGKSLLEANKVLTDMNLYLKIDGEAYDADIPSGHILKQDIPAGNLIKAGRRIGVIISKGPKILYTPMLSGLLIDEAENIARQNRIKIDSIIKVHSVTVENNRVIAQDPNPEERGASNITLVVSIGPPDDFLICPSFLDMTIDSARELAQKIGLDISTSGNGDKVDSQSPAAHTLVRRGDTVKLELTEGKEFKWWF